MKNKTRSARQYGLTLVELMIAMLISSAIILGAVQLFAALNAQSQKNMAMSRNQETGRSVLDIIGGSARQVGYSDCLRGSRSQSALDGKPALLVDNQGTPVGFEALGKGESSETRATPMLTYISGTGSAAIEGFSFFHYNRASATSTNTLDKGNTNIQSCDGRPLKLRAVTITLCNDNNRLKTLCWQENGGDGKTSPIAFSYNRKDWGLAASGVKPKPIVDSQTGQRVTLKRITFIHLNPEGEDTTKTESRPRGVQRLMETTWEPESQSLAKLSAEQLRILNERILYNTVGLRIAVQISETQGQETTRITRDYEATYALPNRTFALYGAGSDGSVAELPGNSGEGGGQWSYT